MDDDQQFCLRWNNHQSTLVSVFDNLLENGTLVDCTLFAEGKFLKAHKVVLSACSPYFETLLTQQYDKHPIFILKDVKFQELKAMMDYMYRGEVNISQDQLAALLKAAESLQIKGLSDSRTKSEETPRKAVAAVAAPPPPPRSPPPAPTIPRVQGLTIEQRKAPKMAHNDVIEDSRSREGSTSPLPRKRKKPRRRPSIEGGGGGGITDNHDAASSSSESHSNQALQHIPSSSSSFSGTVNNPLASCSKLSSDVPEPIETKSDIMTRQTGKATIAALTTSSSPTTATATSDLTLAPTTLPMKEKLETHSELILEPKAEYIEDDMNEDSVEDLTLDDDDVSQMEMDHARPGPSHTDTSQGFGAWHMSGNQNQDEVFLAAQEAVGAHRDSQESNGEDELNPKKKKCIQVISVENVKNTKIIGKLKEELSTHLAFDKIKYIQQVNKKIVDKEISLSKVNDKQKCNIIIQKDSKDMTVTKAGLVDKNYYARQSIASCRMEKFLNMSAGDIPEPKTKQLACLNPVLKTPKDTLRCVNCDVLYDPSKKVEHLKVCTKAKPKALSFGCVLCSFKSTNKAQVIQHVKESHK